MESRNMDALMNDAFRNGSEIFSPKKVESKMSALSNKNTSDIAEIQKDMRDKFRTPTADELVEMRQWIIDYKKANPKESKRQVRIAAQNNFNIIEIRAPHKHEIKSNATR